LYVHVVDTVLASAYNPDENAAQAASSIGGDWRNLRTLLQHIAFWMHTQGPESGRWISEFQLRDVVYSYLCKYRQPSLELAGEADQFIAQQRERGGLIEERNGRFRFVHLSIQEFLVARSLAETLREIASIAAFMREGDRLSNPWWREPFLLLFGYLNSAAPDACLSLMERLLLDSKGEIEPLEIVAESLVDLGERRQIWSTVADAIAKALESPRRTSAIVRVSAGRSLARLGDPRCGVHPRALEDGRGALEFVLCEVQEGPVVLGSDMSLDENALDQEMPQETKDSGPFFVSRYLVTNAIFDMFCVAADGYEENGNWTSEGLAWRNDRHRETRYTGNFSLSNHPVVGVTWFECVAFCRWATRRLNEEGTSYIWLEDRVKEVIVTDVEVRLPTELEWEKAARGVNGRLYSWGDNFDELACNWAGVGANSTSAVGAFPLGQSPYGVLDACGNVWEWCLDPWQRERCNSSYSAVKVDREVMRPVRGGAFGNFPKLLRSACRFGNPPEFESDDLGFRVVVIPNYGSASKIL
jgi:formylglycine-generating enzyme required for sulfatase activity